jgi:hypothetical protein
MLFHICRLLIKHISLGSSNYRKRGHEKNVEQVITSEDLKQVFLICSDKNWIMLENFNLQTNTA